MDEKLIALAIHLQLINEDEWDFNEDPPVFIGEREIEEIDEDGTEHYTEREWDCEDLPEEAKYGNNYYTYGKEEYLVLTDDEADELERDEVERVIEECYLWEYRNEEKKSGRSNPLLNYLDLDKWIDDWCGDRGNNLAGYDGDEHEVNFNDTYYYIYRTN